MSEVTEKLRDRRLLIATFNQARAAMFAEHSRRIMATPRFSWFLFGKGWKELVVQHQTMAEIHALTARSLMGLDE